MHNAGEVPGVGVYICPQCRITVELKNNHEQLPACPCCEQEEFIAVNE